MASWQTLEKDKFDAIYVDTNVLPPSPKYYPEFKHLLQDSAKQIRNSDVSWVGESYARALVAAMLVGARRGDLAPRFFEDSMNSPPADASPEDGHLQWKRALYTDTREALLIVVPFVGLPQCIPALLGISGVIERSGEGDKLLAASPRIRAPTVEGPTSAAQGKKMSEMVYNGVGNAAVGQMLGRFFPDISTVTGNVMFGYSMYTSAFKHFDHPGKAELCLDAGIIALGATRQAGSHTKACMGMGVPVPVMKAVVDAARNIVEFNGGTLGDLDVDKLEVEIRENLAKGVKGEAFV